MISNRVDDQERWKDVTTLTHGTRIDLQSRMYQRYEIREHTLGAYIQSIRQCDLIVSPSEDLVHRRNLRVSLQKVVQFVCRLTVNGSIDKAGCMGWPVHKD